MTSGDRSGTNGRLFWRAQWLFVAFLAMVNTVNVLTVRQDIPELPAVYPIVNEATSGVSGALSFWIAWLAYRAAPLDSRPRWRVAIVHAIGLLALSAFHVTGFVLLRELTYGLLGLDYDFGGVGRWPYELRKDAVGYVLGVTGVWALLRQSRGGPAADGPATFDIRDGAKLVRVATGDILAVTSAGNYVEFVLADGRRPLMRASLSSVEAELAAKGFVRTHRSWLVNAARVTELRPEKSGDYAVGLGQLEAPLSRRFPQALARLRAG